MRVLTKEALKVVYKRVLKDKWNIRIINNRWTLIHPKTGTHYGLAESLFSDTGGAF